MYQGKSLSDLAKEIERQADAKRDFVGSTGDMRLNVSRQVEGPGSPVTTPSLVLNLGNGDSFPIQDHAHSQIGSRLNIPKKYYDRMRDTAPDLLAENVNHWFHKTQEKRLVRTLDGSVRAFLSDRYRPLDNDLVAQFVLPILSEMPIELSSCEVTHSRMYIKVTLPSLSRDVGKPGLGDIVQAGVVISNSETGLGTVSVLPQLRRLICMNGMTMNAFGMKKYHLGKSLGSNGDEDRITEWFQADTIQADNHAFVLKLRDAVKGCLTDDIFTQITDRIIESREETITGKIEKVVEVVNERIGLNDVEGSNVLKHLIEGGDLSMWGIANAVTREANDAKDYDRATELESAGGKLIELPKDQWKEILAAA